MDDPLRDETGRLVDAGPGLLAGAVFVGPSDVELVVLNVGVPDRLLVRVPWLNMLEGCAVDTAEVRPLAVEVGWPDVAGLWVDETENVS